MYATTRIVSFKSTDRLAASLYTSTYGSAVNGNLELKADITYARPDLLSMIELTDKYWSWQALQLLVVNRRWIARVQQLTQLKNVPVNTQKNMLNCQTPGINTKRTDSKYPCSHYWVCPGCLYRRLTDLYYYLRSVCKPDHHVYVMKVSAEYCDGTLPNAALVNLLDTFMRWSYVHKSRTFGINCEYGTALALPYCQWMDDKGNPTRWRVTSNIVMLMPTGRQPGTLPVHIYRKPTADRPAVDIRTQLIDVGRPSAQNLLTALDIAYKYPAQLLYTDLSAAHFAEIHAAFTDGYRTRCRIRKYGNKLKKHPQFKLIEEQNIENHAKSVCSRSPSETPNVEYASGDQRR